MGVKNLWKIIQDFGEKPDLSNKVLAIDSSIWIYHYKGVSNDTIIYSLSKRILKILYNGVRPVFVFDGPAPAIKRETLEARKQSKIRSLILGIVKNKECRTCKKPLKFCSHLNETDEESLNKLCNLVSEKMKNHGYSWGEFSNEEESDEMEYKQQNVVNADDLIYNEEKDLQIDENITVSEATNHLNKARLANKYINDKLLYELPNINIQINRSDIFNIMFTDKQGTNKITLSKSIINSEADKQSTISSLIGSDINPISTFDPISIQHLSKQKKLKILIDLREKRKLTMKIDNQDAEKFSLGQLENVKKRNKISSLIKNLNNSEKTRIQSDWTSYSELRKDVTKQDNIEVKYNQDSVKETMENSDEIDDLLERSSLVNRRLDNEKAKLEESDEIDNILEQSNIIKEEFNESTLNNEHNLIKTADKTKLGWSKSDEITETNELYIRSALDYNKRIEEELIKYSNEKRISIEDLFVKKDGFIDSDEIIRSRYKHTTNDDIIVENQEDCCEDKTYVHKKIKEQKSKFSEYNLFGSDDSHTKIKEMIISLAKIFGVPYLDSPGEADEYCAYLYRSGRIDGVVSEDNDMVVHGIPTYRNFFRKDKNIVLYDQESIGLSETDLIKLCYLLGSDYNEGVPGIGVKKALNSIESVRNEDIEFLRNIYGSSIAKNFGDLELKFDSLNLTKFRVFLINNKIEKSRIDELVSYCKMLQ